MKYRGLSGAPSLPCETFEFGQVEDYCVHLGPAVNSILPPGAGRDIILYPQPAHQWVWVQLPSDPQRLTVFDAAGRRVLSADALGGQSLAQINLSSLAGGMYLMVIESGAGLFRQKMVVVQAGK
ncbi:MAG: T9SS type A sorting domain-containing protein [Saprospirales bacterium]|nr:T9SS type A sorting domain-containing protein [Saprospirales bacterium]